MTSLAGSSRQLPWSRRRSDRQNLIGPMTITVHGPTSMAISARGRFNDCATCGLKVFFGSKNIGISAREKRMKSVTTYFAWQLLAIWSYGGIGFCPYNFQLRIKSQQNKCNTYIPQENKEILQIDYTAIPVVTVVWIATNQIGKSF